LRSGGTWKTIPGGGGTAGLCDSNPQDIGGTALPGSSGEAARCDHIHRGVTNIRKAGDAVLYGSVTLSQGASIGLTQVGQDIAIAYTGAAGDGEPHQPEDFLIFDDSGTYKARNGVTGAITYSGAVAEVVLESCIAAVGDQGLILIKDPIDFSDGDGIVTIVYPRVSIRYLGGMPPSSSGSNPYIQKLVLDSSARDVRGCVFQGISFSEILLDASGASNYIRRNYFYNCTVKSESTANKQGIVIQGNGDLEGYIDNLYFINCYFFQMSSAVNYGFITIINDWALLLYIDRCECWVEDTRDGASFITTRGSTYHELIEVAGGMIGLQAAVTNYNYLDQQSGDACLNVHDVRVEIGSGVTLTMIKIPASSEHHYSNISDNPFRNQTGSTFNVANVTGTNFARDSILHFHDNTFNETTNPTIQAGTTGEDPNFTCVIENNQKPMNPFGIIATPFDNTSHYIEVDGNAAGPTVANQDYIVRNAEIIFNSTGGTAVNITIQDPASTIMYTPGATATYIRVPRDFIVNFGNFSAAPTVTVWFI